MTVTTPKGFRASGVAAGLKASGGSDVAVIVNDGPDMLVYVTAASPPVSMEELYRMQLAPDVPDYDDDL